LGLFKFTELIEIIVKRMWAQSFSNTFKGIGTQTVDDFVFPILWKSMYVWLQIFLKISSFVFCRRKKFIKVWNNLRVSK